MRYNVYRISDFYIARIKVSHAISTAAKQPHYDPARTKDANDTVKEVIHLYLPRIIRIGQRWSVCTFVCVCVCVCACVCVCVCVCVCMHE